MKAANRKVSSPETFEMQFKDELQGLWNGVISSPPK